eukprot:g4279.t1
MHFQISFFVLFLFDRVTSLEIGVPPLPGTPRGSAASFLQVYDDFFSEETLLNLDEEELQTSPESWLGVNEKPQTLVQHAVKLMELITFPSRFGGPSRYDIIGCNYSVQNLEPGNNVTFRYGKSRERYIGIFHLTNSGAPTIVFNRTMISLHHLKNLGKPSAMKPFPDLPSSAWLIYPKRNRFVIFRSDLLHGAPGILAARVVPEEKHRVTIVASWAVKKLEGHIKSCKIDKVQLNFVPSFSLTMKRLFRKELLGNSTKPGKNDIFDEEEHVYITEKRIQNAVRVVSAIEEEIEEKEKLLKETEKTIEKAIETEDDFPLELELAKLSVIENGLEMNRKILKETEDTIEYALQTISKKSKREVSNTIFRLPFGEIFSMNLPQMKPESFNFFHLSPSGSLQTSSLFSSLYLASYHILNVKDTQSMQLLHRSGSLVSIIFGSPNDSLAENLIREAVGRYTADLPQNTHSPKIKAYVADATSHYSVMKYFHLPRKATLPVIVALDTKTKKQYHAHVKYMPLNVESIIAFWKEIVL